MTRPAVGYLVRIELRRRGKSLIVLGLLVSVVVATVVASMAGARRSDLRVRPLPRVATTAPMPRRSCR